MAQLNPYLSFRDNTRQAMEFYRSVFGGKLTLSTYAEFHASEDPAEADKIMHARLDGDNGITFMAADTPNDQEYQPGSSISMSLSGENDPLLRGYFEKLSEGGQIIMPLEKAPWGDSFGMLRDPFGIDWMVNIETPKGS